MSSGSNETIAAIKSKESWLTEPPKHRHPGPRDSNASMISGESYNPSEIGEAVQLSVVEEQRGNQGPVKQTYVQNQKAPKPETGGGKTTKSETGPGDDEESVFSSSTVHLGRLDTIKSQNHDSTPPEISVSTALEEVIPPRSTRRPVSEIISPSAFPTPSYKNHRHRFSLDISDDLDKLMEKASVLSLDDSPAPGSRKEAEISRTSTTTMSRDSFLTADNVSLEERPEKPLSIPKRPNAQNLNKAREASLTQKKLEGSDVDVSSHSSDQVSAHTWRENLPENPVKLKRTLMKPEHDEAQDIVSSPSETWNSSFGSSKYDENPHSETGSRGGGYGSISSRLSWAPSNASASSKMRLSPDRRSKNEDVSGLGKIGSKHAYSNQISHKRTATAESYSDLGPDTPKYDSLAALGSPVKVGQSKTHETSENTLPQHVSPHESTTNKNTSRDDSDVGPETPQHNFPVSATTEPYADIKAESSVLVDDEGFYDIEEPVIVSHPARAKTVKDNIRGPPRKGSHRRSRKFRSREAAESSNPLKPFSYNTLVHLLESMNGTVIGEEFEMLNLPIQEKQLIEKVIDSLSRLTSDMVTDKHRFEIGLQRLEKAHRVLEGFL